MTAGDTIDGGAGADVLNIVTTAAFGGLPVGASITNIETINITSGAAVTFSTAAIAGVEKLNVVSKSTAASTSVTAAATTDVAVTESDLKPSGTSQLIVNGGKDITVSATGTTTNGTAFTASTGAGAEILVGSTAAAAGKVSVVSSFKGADTEVSGDIFVKGGTDVTVTQSLTNTTVAETNVQGAVSVVGGSGTTAVTVNQDATATAAAAVVGKTAGAVTIADANSASLTAAGTITSVTLNNYGASTINSGALTTVNVSGTGGTLGVTAGGLTTAAVSTLTVNTNGSTAGAMTIDADYTTLNINGNTAASTIANVTAAGVTTLNFGGAANVTLTNNTFAAVTDINVTGAGGVTLGTTAIGAAVNFDGGAGNDSIILSNAFTKGITMGAGDDTVTYGGAAGTGGSVAAGAGSDTIRMTNDQAAAADDNATFNSSFTGFEKLSIVGAFTEDNLNLTTLNAVSSVILEGAVTGTAGIVDLASGGTVVLKAAGATTPVLNVTVSNALAGGADQLNLAIENTSAINVGVVAAANVETLNINVADASTLAAGTAAVQHTMSILGSNPTSLVITGNNGLALTSTNNTALTRFDASGVVANGTVADAAANLAVTNTFAALAGASTITGGAGNDTLNAAAAVAAVTMDGGAGNDILTGSATKASNISGGAGNDTITGGAAADVIDGGAGTDTFVFSSANVAEQAGASITTGAVINLGATALTGAAVNAATGAFIAQGTSVASNTATYLFDGDNSTNVSVVDTLTSIENVTGTDKQDYIVGSASANTITGGADGDVMTGGLGADAFTWTGTTAALIATETGSAAGTDNDFAVGLGDQITDFVSGTDTLNFAAALVTNVLGTEVDTLKTIAAGGTVADTDRFVEITTAQANGEMGTAITLLNGLTTTAVAIGDSFIAFINDGTNGYLYLVQQVSTADTIAAQDVTLVGQLTGVTDIISGDLVSF